MHPLVLLQLATTLPLVGLIWFVQVVHYPLFSHVGRAEFARYEEAHAQRTSWVVVAPMLLELGVAAALLWFRPPAVPLWLAAAGFVLVLVIWASTFGLQVPQHDVLGRGFDPRAHHTLVATNWIRTVAWSLRGAVAVAMAAWR